MFIRTLKSTILASLLLALGLFATNLAMAEDAPSIDIAEFHHILDAINQAKVPDNVKDQLFRDMKTSMIENVRHANIPDEVKSVLIKDLESTSRE